MLNAVNIKGCKDLDCLLFLDKVVARGNINYPEIKIYPQKITFIHGESGSGKSTLFKICNGLLTPSSGQIFFKGKDILSQDPLNLRKEILMAPQAVYLFNESIRDNFQKFYGYREQKCISDEDMQKFLKLCQIDYSLDSLCQELSGGERQRVFIAICLSFQPSILMLDEPTAALDEISAIKVIENIINYSKSNGITLMLVSHDLELSKYSDQVIKLHKTPQI